MTSPAVTVSASAGFKEVLTTLRERDISAVPVIDHAGRVIGVVSEGDLILKEERETLEERPALLQMPGTRATRRKAEGETAGELMSRPPVTIEPAATVAEAARLMHHRGVKRLPVVDEEGRVLGIVSRGDVLRVFSRDDEDIRREIVDDVISSTLQTEPASLPVTVSEGVVSIKGDLERRSEIPIVEKLISQVEGVVGLHSELTYRIDDRKVKAEMLDPGVAP
jgi:CBS domain-containing protein